MTQYEQIEKGLIALGWEAEQGKGDHTKFSKNGFRTITVSRNINDKGRSFQNCISNIRKQEPSFILGKLEHQLTKKQQCDQAQQEKPMEKYSFIRPGEKIRYTGAEGKDYTLLNTPSSVMNMEYKVNHILSKKGEQKQHVTSEDDTVEICHDTHEPIILPLQDIDSWEMEYCSCCKTKLPKNKLTTDNGYIICEKCLETVNTQKKKLYSLLERIPLDVKEKFKNNRIMKEISKTGKIPVKDIFQLIDDIEKEIDNWTEENKKRLQENLPVLNPQKNFYDLWKEIMEPATVSLQILLEKKIEKNALKTIIKNFQSQTYEQVQLNNEWKEIRISCKNPLTAYLMVYIAQVLYTFINNELKSFDYIIRIICQQAEFDQYIGDIYPEKNDRGEKLLREILSVKEYDEKTVLFRKNMSIFTDETMLLVNAPFINEKNKTTLSSTYTLYSTERKASFLNGKDKLRELLDGTPSLSIIMEDNKKSEEETNRIISELRRVKREYNLKIQITVTPFKNSILVACLPDYMDKYIIEQTTENTTEQPQQPPTDIMTQTKGTDSSLDQLNPQSSDSILAEYTTRALLKELKDRGVQFTKLSIPIVMRQEFNMDEI